jgi:O-antigen ligase
MAAIVTIACAILILALFWLDREPKSRASAALWIPMLWLLIVCSRPVSGWLERGGEAYTVDQIMDGSPTDRLVYLCLEVAGVMVLANRNRRVAATLRANGPLMLCFAYCAVSLLWSDFPGVGSKRWIKAVGDFAMVLIVLTDRDPITALKRLFSRMAFLLIPLSILFIKYYPTLGVYYSPWGGKAGYTGVTTNKNTLGVVCLVLGLASLWRFVTAYQNREAVNRTRQMIAHAAVLSMVLWLFKTINSMTSLTSFLMAGTLLIAASNPKVIRRPAILHLLIAFMLVVSSSVVFLGLSPEALKTMGRDPSLTGRDEVWGNLLRLAHNAWVGTGFENFWLGSRLQTLWTLYWWHPNEAHNGYLEIYLNLGLVGVALLVVLLITGYRKVFAGLRAHTAASALFIAYFYVALVYNFTEAAYFKMQAPAWIFFLFAITSVPSISAGKFRTTVDNTLRGSWFPDNGSLQPALQGGSADVFETPLT